MPGVIAVVMALVMDRPLCMSCLYERSAATSLEVDRTLSTVAGILQVHRETQRCHACGSVHPTVSIKRPDN